MKVLPTLLIENGLLTSMSGIDGLPTDPLAVADSLLGHGCYRLSLMDVDAARSRGHNREVISRIMHRFRQAGNKVCIQVGGGIRSSDQAQFFLDHGATWLLVGTILHRSPLVVDQLLGRFSEYLTAAIDSRGGAVQASGWSEYSPVSPEDSARRIREQGFKRLLFSDIPETKDASPDFSTAARISQHGRLPILMGGSIRSQEHVAQAGQVNGIQGVMMDCRLILETPALLGPQAKSCE
ncbi:MAG: HisA/HisF-related TIM barrel protein [Holophaga sp.]|nr:HisA/HisF-related TIM barrel protein [Holophaga sp.]